MSIELYDSLDQKNKNLNTKEKIFIYLCGPTVYDDIHIGNLRPVIIFDFLIRYLKEKQHDYFYIQNITDIDDKIIAKAQLNKCSEKEISEKYTKEYLKILKAMNIIMPNITPKVSENIDKIQEIITKLIEEEYAYEKNGDILFKISKILNYTELSKQKLENLNTNKEENLDFTLWKKTDIGKNWDSPWGKGRPGWHTECFAFIEKYCGRKIAIHGGGIDLKFPHHENENAQCIALNKRGLSDIWIHIGHVYSKNKKISKSDHKLFVVKQQLLKYHPNILRYIFLRQNYSIPLEIDEEKIKILEEEFNSFLIAINHVRSWFFLNNIEPSIEGEKKIEKEFLRSIEKNLDLPNIATLIHKYLKNLLQSVKNNSEKNIKTSYSKLIIHLEWLGFSIPNIHTDKNKKLLKEWEEYKNNKDYINADKFRDILKTSKLII